MKPLSPGATIGILGGGQLGRMMSLSAADLGYRVHIFTPETDSPAAEVSAAATVAEYEDSAALSHFADSVDVVTLEFENVPVATLEALARKVPTFPNADVLRRTQHRIEEKEFVQSAGISTAPFVRVTGEAELRDALARIGMPAILKTCRMGYDGKGQARISDESDILPALEAMQGTEAILEGFVSFRKEISVIVARGQEGAMVAYPPAANAHRRHILHESLVPCGEDTALIERAQATARHLAEAIGMVGLLAVEFFVTETGDLLVNELAPRPHNSGHWTMDAAPTSQFTQAIRAVAGLPFGPVSPCQPSRMRNLIGEDLASAHSLLIGDPSLCLHLYGKSEMRPGRKMGHVTRVGMPADTVVAEIGDFTRSEP